MQIFEHLLPDIITYRKLIMVLVSHYSNLISVILYMSYANLFLISILNTLMQLTPFYVILKHTVGQGILFKSSSDNKIHVYVDANWGSCLIVEDPQLVFISSYGTL